MVSEQERALKQRVLAEHGEGNVVFAHTKWGFMAFRKPSEETYLDYLGAVGAPLESTGVAAEQFAIDCMVHPVDTDKEAVAKVRRLFKALPNLASDVAHAIEGVACGEYDELVFDAARRAELDAKWEFGWGGLQPKGLKPIILASDEMSGILIRVANDARMNGDKDNGRKIRSAVLAMVRDPSPDEVEVYFSERPALLMPLWYRAQELAGSGMVVLGKG